MTKDSYTNIIDPATAVFSRGPDGSLRVNVSGAIFTRVWIYRSYPISHRREFLSVRDANNEDLQEIGIIANLGEFPQAVQDMILSELQRRYFVPVIAEVLSIVEARDRLRWEVVTDKGKRKFTVRNPFDSIRTLENNRLLIIDSHNCRFELENYNSLPDQLKYVLSKYIYL
jgi:hypothetical protein